MEELIRELLEEVKGLRRDIQAAFPKPYENIDGLKTRIRGGEFVTTPEPKRLTPDSSGIQAHEAFREYTDEEIREWEEADKLSPDLAEWVKSTLCPENWREDISVDVVPSPKAPGTTILAARQEFSDSADPLVTDLGWDGCSKDYNPTTKVYEPCTHRLSDLPDGLRKGV